MIIKSTTTQKVLVGFDDGEKRPDIYRHFDGRSNRILIYAVCQQCGQEMYVSKHIYKTPYCTRECWLASNRTELECAYCGKRVIKLTSKMRSRHNQYYCNRECKENDQSLRNGRSKITPEFYGKESQYTYRDSALRHNNSCANCGYGDDERMLDVHHVDGDRNNNKLENLRVLCVWCHALETRCIK